MTFACRCGCVDASGEPAHRIVDALVVDDVDAAFDLGLLSIEPCHGCSSACRKALLAARDARQFALDARERFRARQARLARREQERASRRATPPAAASRPALPPAAAAALARARARAAGPKDR